MTKKMKIDVWSDVACPYCYIGKNHLEKALAKFPHKKDVEIDWHSFELNTETKQNAGEFPKLMAKKYDLDSDKAKQAIANMENQAKETGIPMNLEHTQVTNTFDAHRLLHYAKTQGPEKENSLMNNLYADYFADGKNVSDPKVLIAAAEKAGLDGKKAEDVIDSDEFGKEVRMDEYEAQSMGLSGVPFYVFDRKYAVSGAQPVEVFTSALEKAWSTFEPDVKPFQNIGKENKDNAEGCEDGSCKIDTTK